MVYKSEYVLKAFNELFEKKKRPLCLADFKEYFGDNRNNLLLV